MKAGSLTDEIELLKPNYSTNEFGESLTVYESFLKTKANVIHSGGYKTINNNELFWGLNKVFKLRYYVEVKKDFRIKWQNQTYTITTIEKDKNAQQIIITAELLNE